MTTSTPVAKPLDLPRALRPEERSRLRAHLEGQLGRGERHVQVRRAKGGKPRKVRLPADLVEVLRGYLDAFPSDDPEAPLFPGTLASMKPMSRTTGWRRWKKALDAGGLDMEGRGCHAARHGLG